MNYGTCLIFPAALHTNSGGVLLIVVALVCLFVLLLPLDGESPAWPSYSHVTVNQKLIAAFALGEQFNKAVPKYCIYSGAPLLWTPWGPSKVSCIERCPHFRGKIKRAY